MTPFDWLIVLVLNGAVIGYGFYLARGTHSSSDWFLGARSLPWWAVGLSMFATNVDSADLVGVTGSTYSEGIHIVTVYAIGSIVGGILASFWVVPAIYRAGFYTNAEYLEARFGVGARVLSALIQIQYRSSMLGSIIFSAYLLLTRLIGFEPHWAWILIVALVVLAGLYTAWGGLKSVVWTDAAQGVIMLVGALVIFTILWNQVGGWSGMKEKLAAADRIAQQKQTNSTDGQQEAEIQPTYHQRLADMPHVGRYRGDKGTTWPILVVLGWTIIGSGYWTVNHTQTMRLMGTRSLWDMKMAALFGVFLSLPIMVASASMGLFGRAMVPDPAQVAELKAGADGLYPYLAKHYLAPGLKGLVVASVVAAVVSTFDSMGSALSAIFTRDIYARLFVKDRKDEHYMMVSRWATVLILALGFAYLPFIYYKQGMIKAFTDLISVFATPLFTVYLAGVLTRAHRHSGLIGLLGGAVYGMLAFVDRNFYDMPWLPDWLTGRWMAFGWSMLITGSIIGITTLICGLQPKGEVVQFKETGWLQRSREQLPPIKEHPFHDTPAWWQNPIIYAVALTILCFYVVFGLFW